MDAKLRELAQTFHFPGSSQVQLAHVLATAPLVGDGSIFGSRAVKSTRTSGSVRRATGFEPAPIPLLRFDVEISQEIISTGTLVLLEFSQPHRRRPYLAGQFVWLLEDAPDMAVLREEINTPAALEIVKTPLHGSPLSFRRWLFFKGGHQRLMNEVAANIGTLLATEAGPG
ncbi:MAG: hypothetical protein HKN03_17130 [Acidimicrobiales bacterium]|nr:hypothetical protein [Acidimicrobiales bacterium]